eukprot:EC720662.1.p2 GENE.EC720662.1~~EC720662.1.p2  ORF type:complete len:119 (+),score=4.23 EC720662.1:121-477(+)
MFVQTESLKGASTLVTSLAGTATLICSGHQDGSSRIWDVRSGKSVQMLGKVDEMEVASVAFDPSEHIVAVAKGTSVLRFRSAQRQRAEPHTRMDTGSTQRRSPPRCVCAQRRPAGCVR